MQGVGLFRLRSRLVTLPFTRGFSNLVVTAVPPDVRRGFAPPVESRFEIGLRPSYGLPESTGGRSPHQGQGPATYISYSTAGQSHRLTSGGEAGSTVSDYFLKAEQ